MSTKKIMRKIQIACGIALPLSVPVAAFINGDISLTDDIFIDLISVAVMMFFAGIFGYLIAEFGTGSESAPKRVWGDRSFPEPSNPSREDYYRPPEPTFENELSESLSRLNGDNFLAGDMVIDAPIMINDEKFGAVS